MPISFQCTNLQCGKKLRTEDHLVGKRIKCPVCGTVQEVPAPATEMVERFLGPQARKQSQLTANPAIEKPLCLEVLYPEMPQLSTERLTPILRAYHTQTSKGLFEIDYEKEANGASLGLAGWGKHVIRLVTFPAPMPSEAVAKCVQPAHYPQEVKAKALGHNAHSLLYYAGYEDDPREQYVALAVVAGVLGEVGALVVLNESAHTSLPTSVLFNKDVASDRLDVLRAFPLLILFCGFVKYEVEGFKGVWMRTYGNHLLGVPDLAYRAKGHFQGQWVFDTFGHILNYLLESGARFEAGETMQLEAEAYFRFRLPKRKEYFLESEGELFVLEAIGADEINR
jgi:hypothetical protein